MNPYRFYMDKAAGAGSRARSLMRSLAAAHSDVPLFHNTSHDAIDSIAEHGLETTIGLARKGVRPPSVEGGYHTERTPAPRLSSEEVARITNAHKAIEHAFGPAGNFHRAGSIRKHQESYLKRSLFGDDVGMRVMGQRDAVYPTRLHKNWNTLSFGKGVPYRGYGESGIVTTPNRVSGGELHEYRDTRIGREVQALPGPAHPETGEMDFPRARPAAITYTPGPEKAEWVREMKAKGHQMVPFNDSFDRKWMRELEVQHGKPRENFNSYYNPQNPMTGYGKGRNPPGALRRDRFEKKYGPLHEYLEKWKAENPDQVKREPASSWSWR